MINQAHTNMMLKIAHKNTSSMMCSWQAQGPLFAMATEYGECIVWHFPSRERVKVLPNAALKASELEKARQRAENNNYVGAEKQENNAELEDEDDRYMTPRYEIPLRECVRIVKFNPVPLFNYSK